MTHFLASRRALLLAALLGLSACHQSPPPPDARATPPAAEDNPAGTPDKQGVVFGDGFHKEEADPKGVLRWVRRDAALRINAPAEGRYRLTFRPFTVFSTVENTIEVSVNGQPAGTFSTRAFDLSNPTPTTLEAPLHAGDNTVGLHSRGAENPMSKTDDRLVAYGLLVPVMVERAP